MAYTARNVLIKSGIDFRSPVSRKNSAHLFMETNFFSVPAEACVRCGGGVCTFPGSLIEPRGRINISIPILSLLVEERLRCLRSSVIPVFLEETGGNKIKNLFTVNENTLLATKDEYSTETPSRVQRLGFSLLCVLIFLINSELS